VKDMNTGRERVFGVALLLAISLAATAVRAQESAASDDELLPAVDTSATEAAVGPTQDVVRTTAGNRVVDTMQLGRTEITGNQELPKVLYIVPWKKSDPGNLMGKPVNTLLDEVLAPLDREEFIRQVEYHKGLDGTE